ncbi:MAG: serine hydrolase [bacterium]|nr:serine hydrolase [bacterium]
MKKCQFAILFVLISSINLFGSDFSAIDEIVSNGILNGAFPGAQVIIGNEKDVLYEKSYGNFTYDEFSDVVTNSSMFDLASLTKVIATTPAIMKLYEERKINLSDKVSYYLPEFANSGKEDITVLNLLIHNSGLIAFVPFYKTCRSKQDVLDAIFNIGLDYPTATKTVYSDLNSILLGLIVEKISGMPLDEYCKLNVFLPLGMRSTTFVPDETLKPRILPTEFDSYWRNRQLQGEVHDETTAMLEGVSGNAGLFSNASDIYLLIKTMLNKGHYYNPYTRGLQDEQIFDDFTIELFTKRYDDVSYENSRALGWDTKPIQKTQTRIPCGELISENCFGHTGFTGTSVWCDKDRKLVIIFLTNRVYPSRDNSGIRDVRPELHNAAIRIVSEQN